MLDISENKETKLVSKLGHTVGPSCYSSNSIEDLKTLLDILKEKKRNIKNFLKILDHFLITGDNDILDLYKSLGNSDLLKSDSKVLHNMSIQEIRQWLSRCKDCPWLYSLKRIKYYFNKFRPFWGKNIPEHISFEASVLVDESECIEEFPYLSEEYYPEICGVVEDRCWSQGNPYVTYQNVWVTLNFRNTESLKLRLGVGFYKKHVDDYVRQNIKSVIEDFYNENTNLLKALLNISDLSNRLHNAGLGHLRYYYDCVDDGVVKLFFKVCEDNKDS